MGLQGIGTALRDDYTKLTLEYDGYRIYVRVKLRNGSMGHR
jgi:hypothetical protein